MAQPYIAVVGPHEASRELCAVAERVGELLGEAGAVLVCGGLGGVMAAACRGAVRYGGITVGLLPGADRSAANDYLTVSLPTDLGELRNGLIVRAVDAVVAVGGSWGTLNEIALAMRTGTPVVAIGGWHVEAAAPDAGGPTTAVTAEEAVTIALGRPTR